MPSPSKDVVEISSSVCVGDQWPYWVPDYHVTTTQPAVSRVSALRHPASTSNPVDLVTKDRPPSPWSKRWFRGVTRLGNLAIDAATYYAWVYRYNDAPAFSRFPNVTHQGLFWQYVGNHFPFKPTLEFASDQTAKTAVLNKIAQKKWDLGVFAGELRQTAGLVTDLASGMSHTLLSLINSKAKIRSKLNQLFRQTIRDGDFYQAAAQVGLTDTKLLETLRDRWMQYQFGVRPALSELDKGVTWLADRMNRSDVPFIIKAKAGHESMDTYGLTEEINIDSAIRVTPIVREFCRTHYSVKYGMPLGHVRDLTTLGLDNPAAVLWELMLLSWMYDYVLGIGSWLNSFTAVNGLQFIAGTKSVLKRQESVGFQIRLTERLSDGTSILTSGPKLDKGTYFENGSFTRELLTSGVTPAAVPQIKSTLGLVQMANSLFALSNVFSGRGGLR